MKLKFLVLILPAFVYAESQYIGIDYYVPVEHSKHSDIIETSLINENIDNAIEDSKTSYQLIKQPANVKTDQEPDQNLTVRQKIKKVFVKYYPAMKKSAAILMDNRKESYFYK